MSPSLIGAMITTHSLELSLPRIYFRGSKVFEPLKFYCTCMPKRADETVNSIDSDEILTRPRGYKTFFMLNSIEHEFFPAH